MREPRQGNRCASLEQLRAVPKLKRNLRVVKWLGKTPVAPFDEDTRKLRDAIQHGSCTRTEWRPYAAFRGKQGATANV